MQVFLTTLEGLEGDAACAWVEAHLLSGNPDYLIFDEDMFQDLQEDAADAFTDGWRLQPSIGHMYLHGQVLFVAADAFVPRQSTSSNPMSDHSNQSIGLGWGTIGSQAAKTSNNPSSASGSISGQALSPGTVTTVTTTVSTDTFGGTGAGAASGSGSGNNSVSGQQSFQTPVAPVVQAALAQQQGRPVKPPCQDCQEGVLSTISCDTSVCNLTMYGGGATASMRFKKEEGGAVASCDLSLHTCFHQQHPKQFCVKIHGARGSCIRSANAPQAFHFLQDVDICIEPQEDCSTPMDLFLNLDDEGAPRAAQERKRILSEGECNVDRAYFENRSATKLSVAPEVNAGSMGTAKAGELAIERPREQLCKFQRGETVVKTWANLVSSPSSSTAVGLHRDSVATHVTGSVAEMSSITLSQGNQNPILLRRPLGTSSSVQMGISCSAIIRAVQLGTKRYYTCFQDTTETGRLQALARSVIKEKMRVGNTLEINMGENICVIQAQLPAAATPGAASLLGASIQ